MKAVLTFFLALGGVLFAAVIVGVAARLIAFFTRNYWLLPEGMTAAEVVTVLWIIGALVVPAIGGLGALTLYRSAKTRWLSYSIAVSGFLLAAGAVLWLLWPQPVVVQV
jgi:hypothetical protein